MAAATNKFIGEEWSSQALAACLLLPHPPCLPPAYWRVTQSKPSLPITVAVLHVDPLWKCPRHTQKYAVQSPRHFSIWIFKITFMCVYTRADTDAHEPHHI